MVRLTERDLSLLRWINGFRFVEIGHIMSRWHVTKPTAYARIRKLVAASYLIHERIFHGAHGVYRVTKKGVAASGDSLPAIPKVSLNQYQHELAIVKLSAALYHQYGDEFLPARRIKQQRGIAGIGQRGHISDGILPFSHNEWIAIEVEFSSKGKQRRKSIFDYYLKHFEYKELWYFYGDESIKNQLLPLCGHMPFVKLIHYHDFINNKHSQYSNISPIEIMAME